MSEKKEPDADMCAAPDCLLLGSLSDSTQGDCRWLCHLHFTEPPARWPRITAFLEEERWLAASMVALRRARWDESYAGVVRTVRRTFGERDRADLQNRRGESFDAWLRRLNDTLTAAALARLGTSGAACVSRGIHGWARVHFEMAEAEQEEGTA